MRVLVTRPEPDASRQAAKLVARGHEAVIAPLLAIETFHDAVLELGGAQALIVTSRNALRALAGRPELDEMRKLPLFAVGEATAKAAAELAFGGIRIGPGNAKDLAEQVAQSRDPAAGALVHLAGEELAFDLAAMLTAKGFAVCQPVLYRAVPVRELPAETLALLKAGALDGVILMSPRTARVFVALIQQVGTELREFRCYCLSPAIADAARPLRAVLRVAPAPREEDILALIDADAASS